jgi:hypothetical protein
MKQLTNNLLKMNFNGIDLDNVSKIEFAFSQEIGQAPLKIAEYPNKNAVLIADNLIGIAWTQEETALFKGGKHFFADTRITLKDSEYQPETPILRLTMEPTLFEKG